jgi:hypothetical protein
MHNAKVIYVYEALFPLTCFASRTTNDICAGMKFDIFIRRVYNRCQHAAFDAGALLTTYN